MTDNIGLPISLLGRLQAAIFQNILGCLREFGSLEYLSFIERVALRLVVVDDFAAPCGRLQHIAWMSLLHRLAFSISHVSAYSTVVDLIVLEDNLYCGL